MPTVEDKIKMFKTLFGIENSEVRENCVLLPLLPKGALELFKIKKFSRGKLYSAGNSNNGKLTLIHTGMSAGFVGDAVLYLKETACQNVILFGSCGLVEKKGGLSIGSLVSPYRCFAFESFSQMLFKENHPADIFHLDKDLSSRFLSKFAKEVTCATVSSLKLEEKYQSEFIEKGIDVVDMECSSFFAAANYSGLKAAALFYISDIIKENPFYQGLSVVSKAKIFLSIKNAAELILGFSEGG